MTKRKRTAKTKNRVAYSNLCGDPFSVEIPAGWSPADAVCNVLKQWLKTDVTLWPIDGTTYRAQWFSARNDVFVEELITIEVK